MKTLYFLDEIYQKMELFINTGLLMIPFSIQNIELTDIHDRHLCMDVFCMYEI